MTTSSTKDGRPRRTKANRPKVTDELLDRTPPANLEAERWVLGSVVLRPACFQSLLDLGLGGEHFHDYRNGVIFDHFHRLYASGRLIDDVELLVRSFDAELLTKVGGGAHVREVCSGIPHSQHAEHYARIVLEKAQRRTFLRACERGIQLAHGDGELQDAHAELRELLDPSVGKPKEPPRFTRLLTSADLVALEQRPQFIVRGVMVAGQPMVIGARSKAMKTHTAVDLAISIGSGTPFLGKFAAERATVGVWSGESGAASIREMALRIAAAKGVNLGDCEVFWSFDLPRLSQATDLEALRSTIVQRGIQVAILDPLYLCLLSTDTAGAASNLFAMGSVLQPLSAFAQEAGVTLVLLHHFRKSGQPDDSEPAGLEELAQSGMAEWARQWVLLQRRSPYQGDGRHQLWMRTGGSAGHAGLWALDIDEGTIDPDTFSGRRWEVEVKPVSDAKEQAKREREDRKAAELEKTEAEHVERVKQALRDNPDGVTARRLRILTRLNADKIDRALLTLEKTGLIEPCKVTTGGGEQDGWKTKKG